MSSDNNPLNYSSPKGPVRDGDKEGQKIAGKIVIDGQEISFLAGDSIMNVAERAGVAKHIPRYCYHPGLSVAGSCRMCTVEVEKAPKLTTACSTPAVNGMIIHTRSERVKKSRNGVMEFLLTNHPLDCPVCDQAGECELQDYNFEYGPMSSRFEEEKRVFGNATTKPLSDKIMLNMNRCVNCERCVRFEDEVTKTNDLMMDNRGWKKELVVSEEEKGLTSDYQGCLADICPVGALTFRDFRFQKRVWFLEKRNSICDGCSKGCNISVHSDKNIIYRYMPTYNEKVNKHWMCDEGRLGYHRRQEGERITHPTYPWPQTMMKCQEAFKHAETVLIIIGTDATLEEAMILKQWSERLAKNNKNNIVLRYYNGVNGVFTSKDDVKLDHLLRMKDKTPNTRGLEKLGLRPLQEEEKEKCDLAIIFKNGLAAKNIKIQVPTILVGVWTTEEISELKNIVAVLPGPTTTEKAGTFINCDDIPQTFNPAVQRMGETRSIQEIIELLDQRGEK